jgi:phosphoadenosine phosphosulfate reductase
MAHEIEVSSGKDIKLLEQVYEKKTAQEIIKDSAERFLPDIALASSFGAEDVVLIDIISKINPKITVFTLDTGRLNQETYDVIDVIRNKYNIKTKIYFPDPKDVEEAVQNHGINLFYDSIEKRRLCCHIRKVKPLQRALYGLRAWITGLRREQSATRTGINKIEIDRNNNGIFKINPIADWTANDVWSYIKKNNVPYNNLHDSGYPSIGCEPCTRPVKPGEDERAGRWWWEQPEQKECGLHK